MIVAVFTSQEGADHGIHVMKIRERTGTLFAINEAERRRDQYTFEQFARLAKEIPHLCERRAYYYLWKGEGAWKEPWYKDVVFGVSL